MGFVLVIALDNLGRRGKIRRVVMVHFGKLRKNVPTSSPSASQSTHSDTAYPTEPALAAPP